jgi:hypothetical protein
MKKRCRGRRQELDSSNVWKYLFSLIYLQRIVIDLSQFREMLLSFSIYTCLPFSKIVSSICLERIGLKSFMLFIRSSRNSGKILQIIFTESLPNSELLIITAFIWLPCRAMPSKIVFKVSSKKLQVSMIN